MRNINPKLRLNLSNVILFFLFSTHALFYFSYSYIPVKWQIYTPVLLLIPFVVNKEKFYPLKKVDIVFFVWILYSFFLFSISLEKHYLNFVSGIISTYLITKTRYDYDKVLLASGLLVLLVLVYNNLIPSYDYVSQFRDVNSKFGANRVSFILFCFAVAFFSNYKIIGYITFLLMSLYTSRLNIIGAIIYLLFRNKIIKNLLFFSFAILAAIIFFEPWMFEHYLFKVDYSIINRSERYLEYFDSSLANYLMPIMNFKVGPHSLFFELLIFYGFPILIFFTFFFYFSTRKFEFFIFLVFAVSAKQINDLGFFYLFLAWFFLSPFHNNYSTKYR